MKASCVVLLWLISASVADASPTPGRPTGGALCDAQSTTLKKLLRHKRSFGGPLAPRLPRALLGLSDITTRLHRGNRADVNDEAAAIQNDAPAASIDADGRHVPTLHPLGLLVSSFDQRPRSRALSPKSPRGPPFAA